METPLQYSASEGPSEDMEVESQVDALAKQTGEMKISYNWNSKTNQDRLAKSLKKETPFEGMFYL